MRRFLYFLHLLYYLEVKIMATLLEEGVCIIKDKKVAERFLKDLENPPKTDWREIRKRIKQIEKELEEGEEWLKKMKL